MELQDLVGIHQFQGIDFDTLTIQEGYDKGTEYNCIKFKLDGLVYTCEEDPSDGYRSYMHELRVEQATLRNEFRGVEVEVVHLTKSNDQDDIYNDEVWDVIQCIDTTTKKVVLEVGTKNTDDYYPYYVGEYHPEHMSVNAGENNL